MGLRVPMHGRVMVRVRVAFVDVQSFIFNALMWVVAEQFAHQDYVADFTTRVTHTRVL